MEKTEEYIKARSRAIKYIMYKMRTSLEVYNKLKELEFPEKEMGFHRHPVVCYHWQRWNGKGLPHHLPRRGILQAED